MFEGQKVFLGEDLNPLRSKVFNADYSCLSEGEVWVIDCNYYSEIW
jgi:hypothetical protein